MKILSGETACIPYRRTDGRRKIVNEIIVCSNYFAKVPEQCVGKRSALQMAAVAVQRLILRAFNGPIDG